FIEGRHARFSKIGGEMIPHATVETALAKALKLDSGDLPQIAVSARVNEGKGESLVLISTVPVELAHVKEALKSEGISNLWIPKHIVRVDKIPILASGKLDLKKLAELAKE
ncbi:MAG: AMP-dependent synthetase, partial [Opitutales bacterium]|nr:AMP-dependent synthetase [Opitutales bacterium]